MPRLMQQYDALLHPSCVEGLPNAICEALAAGRPVLASNIGDHSILLNHGERGLLFNPHDEVEMADAIRAFAQLSQAERDRMGTAGRKYAKGELDMDRRAGEYLRLFSALQQRDLARKRPQSQTVAR
jgi:glycosyltransferase involved in cell wall biosynthesis